MDGGFEGRIYVIEDEPINPEQGVQQDHDEEELEAPDFLPSDVNPLIDVIREDKETDILKLDSLSKTESSSAAKVKGDKVQSNDTKAEPGIDEEETEDVRREVYLPYQHVEWVTGCRPHPGNIVEPASLAVIESVLDNEGEDISQSLPGETITAGHLSSLQLESVRKASQRHRVILPNNERAGFFIGDAAGVGKGRQIAAIIMNNFCRGRKKHIWFSVSTDLIIDAKRDLSDIGCHINVIDGCQQIDRATKLFGVGDSAKYGVVFSTYSTLVSSTQSGSSKKSRLQQLIDWCGGESFDGCLFFDECHKAKNFVPGNESASSKVALAVCSIQQSLPKARVVYCSATGVTDVKNMAFMERMGLWGINSAFNTYTDFLDTIQKKGLGIAEMLAMDMKRDGLYVSRMLSFSDAQFYNIECYLTAQQKLCYNMAAHIWNETRKALAVAVTRCRVTKSKSMMFWSQHQKFFQQLCISMKVGHVVEEAKTALADNKCVVIGLQNTGEANMEGKLARDGVINDFFSSCREILLNFLNNHFPVERLPPPQLAALQLPVGQIEYDEWSLRARSMLLQYANQLDLPNSALDMLIDELGGPSKVAEMTGRRGRIVRLDPLSKPSYQLRQTSSKCLSEQSLNVEERDKFMSGEKLVAVISDAASTGISLHADRKCGNTRQRVHITLQLPWSADKAVQQLGRSHRSNQASGPIYKLITTELGGERRFAASVARRLQSLGALTKGDRRAATGADLSMFNYDTIYGRTALKFMYQHICKGEIPQPIPPDDLTMGFISPDLFIKHMQDCLVTMGFLTESELEKNLPMAESDCRDVGRFLNRILGLQVTLQNMIFNFFVACLDVIVSIAKKEGKFNEGFVDLTGNSMCIEGKPKAVFTALCQGCRHYRITVDRGMSWAQALKRFQSLKGDNPHSGFYKTRNAMHNRYYYMLVTPHSPTHFKIARPNTGINVQEVDMEDLEYKYEKITLERAVGMRKYSVNMISGSLMRILPLLETTMLKYGLKLRLNKYEANVKVVRVCLDNGERLIGFQFPQLLMAHAERESKAMAQERGQNLFSYFGNKIEAVSPVIAALFKRACTPPPTLKNYFTIIKPPTKEMKSLADTTPTVKSDLVKAATPNLKDEDIEVITMTTKDTPNGTPKETPKNTARDTQKDAPKDTPKETPRRSTRVEKRKAAKASKSKENAAEPELDKSTAKLESDDDDDDDIICVLDTTPSQKFREDLTTTSSQKRKCQAKLSNFFTKKSKTSVYFPQPKI